MLFNSLSQGVYKIERVHQELEIKRRIMLETLKLK